MVKKNAKIITALIRFIYSSKVHLNAFVGAMQLQSVDRMRPIRRKAYPQHVWRHHIKRVRRATSGAFHAMRRERRTTWCVRRALRPSCHPEYDIKKGNHECSQK